MALWPFRRRSSRKRSRSGANLSDVEGAAPARARTEGVVARAGSQKKQRTGSPTVQRRQRTYSFSPGRRDSIRVSKNQARPEQPSYPGTAAIAEMDESAWERTPTLHHKSTKHHPPRRKSSKKRKEAVDREAEIKAMSNFMPTRPATDAWQAGRPMKRDSKRARTVGPGAQWNDPASEVSLPLPGSIHSTMSSDSEYGSYKISALDSLAPRPTLRYTHEQRWRPSHASVPERDGSQKRPVAERMRIPKETLKANKRIDDLADDLDAGELRELLERDERRRERKRQLEQERVERRLARRAEKQRKEEAEAQRNGTPSPENLERGVIGRELYGLGIEPASTVVTSSKQRETGPEEPRDLDHASLPKKPSDHFEPLDTTAQGLDKPAEEATRTVLAPELKEQIEDTSKLDQQQAAATVSNAAPDSGLEPEPVPTETVQAGEQAPASSQPSLLAGLLRTKKSRSKSTLNSDREKHVSSPPSRIDEEDVPRKTSIASQKGNRFSFTSLLRWGSKGLQTSRPSSFSNASREEMQAAAAAHARTQSPAQSAAQAHAFAQAQALARLQGDTPSPTPESLSGNYVARRGSEGVPKRTRSRFREDLPDFPLSPPDSRVQSPEADPLPALPEQSPGETGTRPIPIPRLDTPASGHRQASTQLPSPEPHMSMSLASIDSEASWLSGRMGSKRASTVRESIAKANRREDDEQQSASPTNSTQEDLAIAEDEYMSKLAPKHSHNHRRQGSLISGEGRPSSDEGDIEAADMKWGAVGARAHMVHSHVHDRETMKSREGFLDMDTYDQDSVSESSPITDEKEDFQRARSVNLGRGGHARNFSAGSAKLFEITRSRSARRSSLS
ncbi:hypothetical protein HJFPF1_06210 [Paramyrothecium foliicola]|nr:hypothetical protein HJFPF1_06210 [Paramyrothecium foliicola]